MAMFQHLSLLCLLVVSVTASHRQILRSTGSSRFVLSVVTNGTYSFLVNNKTWLTNSPTYFNSDHTRLTAGKELLSNVTYGYSGHDVFGQWQSSLWTYTYLNKTYDASIVSYPFLPIVIFYQRYLNNTLGTSSGDYNSVISAFPSFQIGKNQQTPLGYMSIGGSMAGGTDIKIGRWGTNDTIINGGVKGGLLILFDTEGNVLIIAPFNQFMVSSVYQDRAANTVSWGIMGGVDFVPKDTSIGTMVMFSDKGINKALSEWGQYMRLWYQKDASYKKSDLTVNYLGYWTDNGAYYYYQTAPGLNYEETIMSIASYGNAMDIPYRYIQYDSWFYRKGPNDGTASWTTLDTDFPHGLQWWWFSTKRLLNRLGHMRTGLFKEVHSIYLWWWFSTKRLLNRLGHMRTGLFKEVHSIYLYVYDNTSLPCAANNKWWSSTTVYAKQNGGDYFFLMDGSKAVPIDERFWDDLLRESKKWGLVMYEQSSLDAEFMAQPLLTDLALGRAWLLQMGRAAANNGLTIQYCLSNPRHALQSLEIPTVTQARVSEDYQPGNNQWKIGVSSMFADALGLAPSKDTFWTTSNQTGNKYDLVETNPARQTLVATFSTGPVGPGDKLGETDPFMLQMCCNVNGLILKPSKPLTAINKQIQQAAFNDGSGPRGEVWTTHSEISGYYFGTIFAVTDSSETYKLTPKDANFDGFTVSHVFRALEGNETVPVSFSQTKPLNLTGCQDFCLWYTSPRFVFGTSEIFIYGEVAKWVPMSPQRVTRILRSGRDIQIRIQGAEGEDVKFAYMKNDNGKQTFVTILCRLGPSGRASISFLNNNCRNL